MVCIDYNSGVGKIGFSIKLKKMNEILVMIVRKRLTVLVYISAKDCVK